MADANLVKYIKDNLAAGYQRQEIADALLKVGWAQSMIDEGFAEVQKTPKAPEAVATPAVQSPAPKAIDAIVSTPVVATETKNTLPPTSGVVAAAPDMGTIAAKPQTSHFRQIIIIAGAVVVVLGVGTAYSYYMKLGPFARPPYTADNLVQGLLLSASRIETSAYTVSGSLALAARDADAKPLTLSLGNVDTIKQYQRDAERASNIGSILQSLKSYPSSKRLFPASLQQIANKSVPLIDPATNQPYEYVTKEQRKNFTLSVTFETDSAITRLKQSYDYSASTTFIEGKKVTFTKDSSSYFYFSATPPKPWLVELSDSSAYLPGELKASLSASAESDWRQQNADWKFNINADGDFGDLAYKVNIDALKKNGDYYFKINNLPSLLSMFFGSSETIKGKWVKIDATAASPSYNDYYGMFSSFASQLPEAEKSYKEQRQAFVEVLKKAAAIADEEHLLTLKYKPTSERIGGRALYRYELKINKTAISSFYKRLMSETNASKLGAEAFVDAGYAEYLQSPEFNEIFDYYDKNTSLTLWVDAQGFPAIAEYVMRVVPPDTATQLQNKQMNVVLKLELSNINKPVDIQAPKDAKSMNDLTEGSGGLNDAGLKSRDAHRISDIRQLELALELYADANYGSYPKHISDLTPTYLPSMLTDPSDKSSYYYAFHTSNGVVNAYHIGANLEDAASSGFQGDNDCNSKTGTRCIQIGGSWSSGAFNGSDDAGCGGEKNRYCFDLVTP